MGAEPNSKHRRCAEVIPEIVNIELQVYLWVKKQTVKREVQTWLQIQ